MALGILEAVTQAADELSKGTPGGPKEKEETPHIPGEVKKEEKKEEKVGETSEEEIEEDDEEVEVSEDEEEEDEDDDLSEEDLKHAKTIARVLRDPAQAKIFAKQLQIQFGEETSEMSVADKKKAAEELTAELRKLVGEENENLLPGMIAVFEKLYGSREKILMGQFAKLQNQMAAERIMTETNSFLKSNKVTEEETIALDRLSKEIVPSKGLSTDKYLSRLLTIVRGKAEKETANNGRKEKIAKNLKERDKNLEARSGLKDFKTVEKPAKMSAKDAVLMAARGEKVTD